LWSKSHVYRGFAKFRGFMLKIHELILPSGELSGVFLARAGEQLLLVSDEGELPLPAGALPAVMRRYGSPFDPEAQSQVQGELALPGDARLQHVRHLAGYDVIARDYLVYTEPEVEPVCVMATTVAGALRHLAQAAKLR
jgi:hypothetical protein